MNNQSPLVPPSSFLEQKNQGRDRVKIAVFVVLAIHGIGLMALLMQGCQKPPEMPPTPTEETNAAQAFVEPTNSVATPTNAAVGSDTQPAPPVNLTPTEPPAPLAPPTSGTEYVVAKGDTFGTLAKKFHVSVKAITEANPGVVPRKLKIGQKLQIPAAAAPTAAAPAGALPAEASSTSASTDQPYTVKSGDTLGSIAKEKHTTVKALRAANSLKTDRITVGQKLKIPGKAPAPVAGSSLSAEPAVGASTSTPPAAPSGR
jgi:LysM repeat protein